MDDSGDTSKRSARALTWAWHDGCSDTSVVPTWLSDIRALRSRVLYDEGRRPRFLPGSAGDGDPDPLDLHSRHIVVSDRKALVGCVRITPVSAPIPCATEQAIGHECWEHLLRQMGVPRDRIVEHGRWVVAREYKDLGTGVYLMALSFALAYKLGYPSSVATASRDVVEMLEMAGAKRAPGVPVLHSEHYEGEAIVLYGHQTQFTRSALQQFERSAELLRLGRVYAAVLGTLRTPPACGQS